MSNRSTAIRTGDEVRAILLKLARRQEELAAREAAAVPYWEPCQPSVIGHRAAAEALREQADDLLVPPIGVAS